MARSEARLQFGLWRTGLAGVSPHAKLLYCVLLTEPTLNHCGVGRVCLPLWAADASLTEEEAEKALRELRDGAWVVVDDATYEVFVRTLIRNDGVSAQPYVLKGALREAVLTVSPVIRQALAAELRKLPPRQPDGVSKTGKKVTYPDPHETADQLDPPPAPKPTRKPSERVLDTAVNPSETLHGEGGGGGGGSVVSSSDVGSVPTKPAPRRATRIPDDFTVTPAMVAWAKETFPHIDGREQTERFRDHFRAAPGQKGMKLDWVATWRNWIREASERAGRYPPGRHLAPVQAQLPIDPRDALADLRERRDAAAASRLLGIPYLPEPQRPSDRTPPREYDAAQALAFIDLHAAALDAVLTERKATG